VNDAVCGALTCKSFGDYVVLELTVVPADGAGAAQAAMDLAELCDRIAWDEKVRVVVLVFDGGMDKVSLPSPGPADAEDRMSFARPVAGLKQPVIAAIRGNAMGPGLELALACDIRIGTQDARFGLPQVGQGRMPADGGTQRLPRLVGRGKAMQMILTGEPIDAEEACRTGLIHRIVPSESLMQAATDMAREMAEKSPLSLSYCKEALHKGLDLTLAQGIQMELDLYLLLFSTADRVEGVTAFKEKRKPKFEGA
jgi:enoyl-CoA hydratase/carnithine racemase